MTKQNDYWANTRLHISHRALSTFYLKIWKCVCPELSHFESLNKDISFHFLSFVLVIFCRCSLYFYSRRGKAFQHYGPKFDKHASTPFSPPKPCYFEIHNNAWDFFLAGHFFSVKLNIFKKKSALSTLLNFMFSNWHSLVLLYEKNKKHAVSGYHSVRVETEVKQHSDRISDFASWM